MYGYIYDVFLSDSRYEKELIQIENSLTDFGLKGTIIRLSLINNIGHAVQDLLHKGVTTIVAVGGDQLVSKVIDYADQFDGITLGIIPIGQHQMLASLFGVPSSAQACATLAARNVRPISLGKINNAYFIYSVVLEDPSTIITCDGQFSITPTTDQAIVSVHNLYSQEELKKIGSLSVMITPMGEKSFLKKRTPTQPTVIKSQLVQIMKPQNIRVVVDGQKIMKTPVTIEVVPKKVQVIMGKERAV